MKKFGTNLRKFLMRVLRICVLLYLLVCLGCAAFQRHLIYFPPVLPSEQVDAFAQSAGLERWRNAAGQPIGWRRPSPTQPATGAVLVTHGNAGCAFQCAHYADAIQQAAPFDVYIVEYPGYADRPGSPSEKTLYASAEEAFQLLPANMPIYVVGESLGTGVAAYLAGNHPDKIAGLVMLAPYNRLADVAQAHFPILPVHLVLCDRFPSEDYLRKYNRPVAVLVAGEDQVVPEKFGRRLFDRYAGPKRLWEFPGGNHGTVMEQPVEIWKQIVDFLQTDRRNQTRN